MELNRYWGFHYNEFYPSGGMLDAVGSSDDFDDLKRKCQLILSLSRATSEAHVYDTHERKIVWAEKRLKE